MKLARRAPFRHLSAVPRPVPHPNCYWIPGTRILAGEYPGAPDPMSARRRLRRLLDAGVTYFVDLTEADEWGLDPYEHFLRDEAQAMGVDVEYVRLPIQDANIPSVELMARILDTLDDAQRAGHTVYVHCWGGVGRTGTVVGCHLVRCGTPGEEALAEVARLFATMSPGKLRRHPEGSPQTLLQREFVRRWKGPGGPATRGSGAGRAGHVRGALVGLAVGDAVGTALEFREPGSFTPIYDMVGGGPFRLQPGEWTDDTAMALCLAESLVERRGFDALDQMERYVRWYREGYLSSTGRCFDIGVTTRGAIDTFLRTGQPYAGPGDPGTAGNGSIMRLAPVAMFFRADPANAIARCAESSLTTHGARVAVDACRYLGALLVGAMTGAPKRQLLSPQYAPVPGYWAAHPLAPPIAEIAGGSFLTKNPPAIRGTGFAAASLEAALWAFARSETFRDGCLLAANLGDDADTTAAVYGQIAGAFYGEDEIPADWRARLARWETIDELAQRLVTAVG